MRSIQIPYPPADGGPCAPAALSVLLGKTFDQVNEWLVRVGARTYNHKLKRATGGTHFHHINFSEIGFKRLNAMDHKTEVEHITGSRAPGSTFVKSMFLKPMTVNKFAQLHPTGSFLLSSGLHAIALKNGIVYDVQRDSSKMRLQYVYEQIGQCSVDFDRYPSKKVCVIEKKGDKTKAILQLLAQGINNTKVLMARTNASYIYTRRIVCQYNKTQTHGNVRS